MTNSTHPDTMRAARAAGLSYLGLALTGMLGFLLVRSSIYVPADAAATLANVLAHESLARAGVALELGIVLTQALAAVAFFALFRSVSALAAGALAAFGLINSTLILGSATLLAGALSVALDPSLAPGGDATSTVQLLYVVSGHAWSLGGLFFGLWLMPMGYLVIASGTMPRVLGWILIAGGVGYVLSAFTASLLPQLSTLTELLALPATVGELWMIGYLLTIGVRRGSPAGAAVLVQTTRRLAR